MDRDTVIEMVIKMVGYIEYRNDDELRRLADIEVMLEGLKGSKK